MALPKLDAPRYEMSLPSTGDKVIYRPYLVKEEKILMLAIESQDEKQMIRALKDVISACTEGSVNTDDMTMFDLEYVFTQLRSKSVGEKTTVGIKCASCETNNDVEIDLSQVHVDVPNKKIRKIDLTSTVGVMLKYPSVDDILKAQTEGKKTDIDRTFDMISTCIDYIYSGDEIFDAKEQSSSELKEFIESLNSEQFGKIKKFIEEMPNAKIGVSFSCSSCSTQNSFDVKGIANFFG